MAYLPILWTLRWPRGIVINTMFEKDSASALFFYSELDSLPFIEGCLTYAIF